MRKSALQIIRKQADSLSLKKRRFKVAYQFGLPNFVRLPYLFRGIAFFLNKIDYFCRSVMIQIRKQDERKKKTKNR